MATMLKDYFHNIVIIMSICTPCLNHVLPLSMSLRRSEDCNDELLIARLRASFSVARFWMGGRCVGRNGGQSKCTKTDLIDCCVLKNVKVLTHNLADHHLYRTSQIHEVLAIIWCIFSGPHWRIPRIIFCEISVYLLVIQFSRISILLSPVFVSPSERFPLVFPEPFARFYSFLPKAHLRSSPH